MAEYYRFLLFATWPAVLALLGIWLFVISRLIWKVRKTCRFERDAWGFLVLFAKILLWGLVLSAYTMMFVRNEPDWFAKPGNLQGVISEKAQEEGKYAVRLTTGQEGRNQESRSIYFDLKSYVALKVGDEVKVTYLPYSGKAITCEVLSRTPAVP